MICDSATSEKIAPCIKCGLHHFCFKIVDDVVDIKGIFKLLFSGLLFCFPCIFGNGLHRELSVIRRKEKNIISRLGNEFKCLARVAD